MGMFTELAILYSKYDPSKMQEHLNLYVGSPLWSCASDIFSTTTAAAAATHRVLLVIDRGFGCFFYYNHLSKAC